MKTSEKNSLLGFNKATAVELNMQQLSTANSGQDTRYRDDIMICWTFTAPETTGPIYSCFCNIPQDK